MCKDRPPVNMTSGHFVLARGKQKTQLTGSKKAKMATSSKDTPEHHSSTFGKTHLSLYVQKCILINNKKHI